MVYAYCHNGGPGSIHCSITGGISILSYGITNGCEVTCIEGYYSCCSLRCLCVPMGGSSGGAVNTSGEGGDNDNTTDQAAPGY